MEAWRKFKGDTWKNKIDVKEFILDNYTLYEGDSSFLCDISEKTKNYILEKGTNLKYGARPLRRAIQRYIEDEISEMILRGVVHDGQNISIDLIDENLKFNVN